MLFLLALRLSLCSRKLSFVFVFSKQVFALLFFCPFPYFYFFVGSWFLSVASLVLYELYRCIFE